MRIRGFRVKNLKSVEDSGQIDLGPVTLLVGPNNSGKSTLLRGLGLMQISALEIQDRRDRSRPIQLTVDFDEVPMRHWHPGSLEVLLQAQLSATLEVTGTGSISIKSGSDHRGVGLIPAQEPHHLVYPYGAKRKVVALGESVNLAALAAVTGDLSNLVAKIDRVSTPAHPAHARYVEMCEATLGFVVTTFSSPNGKMAGIYVNNYETISLNEMGEGVSNLVGLIAELCVAEGRLFLVEELENDLHPQALKRLLALIAVSCESNQFVVSTHSNIVVRHLGALDGAVLHEVVLDTQEARPTTTCRRVGAEVSSRTRLLDSLGYELNDFDLWEGWLLLEESSAERLIRDHLIRWFTPRLSSTRTLAVGGVSRLEPTFEDFRRLFLFTHLEDRYRGRAWIVADGDAPGLAAVASLQAKYGDTWPPGHFRTWSASDFERYYPAAFAEDVDAVMSIPDRQPRREAKRGLLERLLKWIAADDQRARDAFAVSAHEVIELLEEIDQELHAP